MGSLSRCGVSDDWMKVLILTPWSLVFSHSSDLEPAP